MRRKPQPSSARRPKPAPEIKKLSYFLGKWTTVGTIFPGPWGAGGKFSWKENTQWMSGGFFLMGHWDFKMPPHLGGDGEELFIIGYDARQKVYTFDAFSSRGLHQTSRGRLRRNTWIWTSEAPDTSQIIHQKMTMSILSATSYTVKFEISNDGATWTTFMEGRATKR